MANGNTGAVLFDQLPRLNLPTTFEHSLENRFWAVV